MIEKFLAAILILLPRLSGIDRLLWKDEILYLKTLNVNILENPLFFGVTTNLPLFFYTLRILGLGLSEWIYRLIPLTFSLLGGLVAFNFIKKEFNVFSAWAFIILYAFSPLQIYYAQELRPYTLLQLLLILNLIYLFKVCKYKNGLSQLILFSFLIVLTHYSGYFFLLAELAILTSIFLFQSYKKGPRGPTLNLMAVISGALLFGLILSLYMMRNPSFSRSIVNLEVGTNWNLLSDPFRELKLFVFRFKEVLTFYYWYGLYYFTVDPLVQFVYKKLIVVLLVAAAVFYLRVKNIVNRKEFFFSGVLLLLSLCFTYAAEKFGYFPFGGRHIMPYSFLLYFIFSLFLSSLNKFRKTGYFLLAILIVPIVFFDYCTFYKLPKTVIVEKLQGNVFEVCTK